MLPPPLQDLTLVDDPNSISFSSADINSSTSSSSTRSHHHNSSSSSSHALSDASIADLRLLHRLGCGDIGTVYLAELKCVDGVTFAAKVMDKKELQGRNKEGRARIEREILQVLDHPFLPRLYAALESPRWSCLLTEFCPGGDLHLLRQRQPGKRFAESTVRFYASEVVVALEYVHMMGIVYRDLKPENVLVRSDGHIMLTDFDLSLKCDASLKTVQILTTDTMSHGNPLPSADADADADTLTKTTGPMSDADYSSDMPPPPFASTSCILPNCIVPSVSCFQYARHKRNKKKKKNKYWSEGRGPKFVAEPLDVRSMSFVGTHEYLAPEIVSGEGHGSPVDWWTLGIFLFELLYGFTPFRGQDNEQTLANIVARALEFPKEPPISAGARDLIAGLLVKDPAKRLACSMGAVAIRQHSFFHGIKWALLRCVSPPYVPPPFVIRDSPEDSCPGTPVEYY